MSQPTVPGALVVTRRPPPRLLRARRRLGVQLVQLLFAAAALALGLLLPRVRGGPTVEAGQMPQLLFTLGLGVVGVVTIVFSLLFGVVQWSASSFSPRLNLFRDDPLVWRTFAVTIAVFVYSVSAGLASGNAGEISILVPVTAVVGVLFAFGLIRALQTRAFLSLQLSQVLAALTARGRDVIDDLYPLMVPGEASASSAAAAALPPATRTVDWPGPPGVVQQLDLEQLLEAATSTDAIVVFRVGVGDTLHEASPFAEIHGGDVADRALFAAVVIGVERSFDQDPMLAIRLLTDIALRALSPAVNDPATGVDALNATEGLLRALAVRDLGVADVVDRNDVARVRLVLPMWEDFLRTGIEDLLPFAASVPMVLERIQRLLTNLLDIAPVSGHDPLTRLRGQVEVRLATCRQTSMTDTLSADGPAGGSVAG